VNTHTVILADDHPLFRAALREAVRMALPEAAIVEAESFDALHQAMQQNPEADLVLLDLHMPGVQGFSSLLYLRAEHPAVAVVMVSADDAPANVQRARQFGAGGFIPKSAALPEISRALRAVLDGGESFPAQTAPDNPEERQLAQNIASLSPQQLRVLLMLADGRLNKQIAYELGITEATVKAHVTAILRKLGLVRRTQAAVLAQRLMQSQAASLAVADVGGGGGAGDED